MKPGMREDMRTKREEGEKMGEEGEKIRGREKDEGREERGVKRVE